MIWKTIGSFFAIAFLWCNAARATLSVDYRTEILNPAQNVLDIAVDSSGNVWVIGNVAFAAAFTPTEDALQPTWQGPIDVFVAKLDPQGEVVYGTYIPTVGQSTDQAGGVTVDAEGNVYITGDTNNGLAMTTPDAFQALPPGNGDTFLIKLDPDGQLLYASHIGGNGRDSAAVANDDAAAGVAVDSEGNVFVVGATSSTDFPVMNAVQGERADGNTDAFVMKFDSTFALQWSTYYGNEIDYGKRAVTDAEGNVYVTGWADQNFPTTPGAFQETAAGSLQYFVTKFDSDGMVTYSTYFNGVEDQTAFPGDIGVDATGQVVLGGYVFDTEIVTTAGSFQPERPSPTQSDAFLAKLNADGSDLAFGTYVGGGGADATAGGVGIGPDGAAFIAGNTTGDFPVTDEIDPLGSTFLAKMTADGSAIDYSTRLNAQRVRSLAVGNDGSVYLVAEVGTPGSVVIKISAQPCSGDCDGDETVMSWEVVSAVSVALGRTALPQCSAADPNSDGSVSIAELVRAVDATLDGCP